jgi:hypothetical protein
MKRFALSRPTVREERTRSALLRMGALAQAQLRDAVEAVHVAPDAEVMEARLAELLRLEVLIGPPAATALVLVALTRCGQGIAAKATRLERGEAFALCIQPMERLARDVLERLGVYLQSLADRCAPVAEPIDDWGARAGSLVAMLVPCMNGRPSLAGQCADLFALVKAWERAADLIDELPSSTGNLAPWTAPRALTSESKLLGAA